MVGQAQRFQLVVAKEVGLLDDYDGCASPFGLFSGQRVGGLGARVAWWVNGCPPSEATMRWWMPRTPTVGSGR